MHRNSPWSQQGRPHGTPARNPGARGISNDRGFGNDAVPALPAAARGGPLATDHLQLHDLDLELALLKRKRELIEQQQTMLLKDEYGSGGSSSQYRFNLPREGFGQQYSNMRKYSEMYEERGQGDRYERPPGFKRSVHPVSVWDSEVPPKRPARPRRPGPPAHHPPPLMSTPTQKPRFQPRDRPSFNNSSRISKPKQHFTPNKLNSYPVNERKKLVEQAAPQTKVSGEVFVFDSKKPTPGKVTGRLELALGNILREMRTQYGAKEPFTTLFIDNKNQRTLKQALRDRIRTIMDGKEVGTTSEIMTLYRNKYPKNTDLALLNKLGNFKGHNSIDMGIIETENPTQYFRANFNKLLSLSLNKMFAQIQKIGDQDKYRFKPVTEIYDNIAAELQKDETVGTNKDADKSVDDEKVAEGEKIAAEDAKEDSVKDPENSEIAIEGVTTNTDEDAATIKETDTIESTEASNAENASKNDESMNTTQEGEIVSNTEEAFKNDDSMNTTQEGEIVSNTEEASKNDESMNTTQEGEIETPVISVNNVDKITEEDNDGKQDAIDLSVVPDPDFTINMQEYNNEPKKAKFFNRFVSVLLKRQLPYILPKFKSQIMNIIRSDPDFMNTRDFLIATAEKKLNATKPEAEVANTPDGKPVYVKILGRPGLPRKATMKAFLETFSPIVIKKHRTVHNILFVGFNNMENFNGILAKNGTQFGKITLDIQVSEKAPRRNKPNSKNKDTTDTTESSICIDESLDNQITDLLTTIRQEEEKRMEVNSNNEVVEGEKSEVSNETAPVETDDFVTEKVEKMEVIKEDDVKENGESQNEKAETIVIDEPKNEKVEPEVPEEPEGEKNDLNVEKGPATRASSRLAATPRTVATRRTSRLQNN